jgi:formyl-CoA transferase
MNLAVVNEDRDWPVFCRLVNRPDLAADPRFADTATRRAHALDLLGLLEAEFAKRTLDEWQALLRGSGITYGYINRVADAVNDPQTEAAGAIRATANAASTSPNSARPARPRHWASTPTRCCANRV